MRKLFCLFIALALFSACACAESAETLIVELNDCAMLITADGEIITPRGEYDSINMITRGDCPAERALYCASSLGALFIEFDDALDDDFEYWDDIDGDLEDNPPDGEDAPIDEMWTDDFESEEGEVFVFNMGEYIGYEYDYVEQLYALMNYKGELLTGFDYSWFEHDADNAVVVAYKADGFKSALDESGNVLLEGPYAAIVSDGAGGYFATMPDLEQTDEYGAFAYRSPLVHVSATGEVSDTGIITDTWELLGFESGLMCVASYSGETLKYIYVDASGADAFNKSFSEAFSFTGDYAEVYDDDGSTKLINKSGEYVTGDDYAWFDFGARDDLPIVANLTGGGFCLLDNKTLEASVEIKLAEDETSLYAYHSGDNLISAFSDIRAYIYDTQGNLIYVDDEGALAYSPYNDIDDVPERIVISTNDGVNSENYLINFDGDIISDNYQQLSALSWISGQGRYLTAEYELIEYEYEGQTYYNQEYTAFGVIDQDGKAVLDMIYTDIAYLSPTRYWACDGEKFILFDQNGASLFELPLE